jgi:release factor glutamine methyltransferase
VFVPRRRSELLVRHALRSARQGATVVDLCCGSAAVGVAIALAIPAARLHAADLDAAAVACARRNVARVGGHVHHGDLFDPLPRNLRHHVDILVVNAPYVPTSELAFMPREARCHEPAAALDGGADGLDLQRRITARAATWLAPGGQLLIETSRHLSHGTVAAFHAAGLTATTISDPDLDATIVVGSSRPRPDRYDDDEQYGGGTRR